MQTPLKCGIVWFRRDLRTNDNMALTAALAQCERVHCVFVFDSDILGSLPRVDRRVEFIRESLVELDAGLRAVGGSPQSGLIVLQGRAIDTIPALAAELGVDAVFAARDYEPLARSRDDTVRASLAALRIQMTLVKDHVIFEEREVLTQAAQPYAVFTPYKRTWLAKLASASLAADTAPIQGNRLAPRPARYVLPLPTLQNLGFEITNLRQLRIPTGMSGAVQLVQEFWLRLDRYGQHRDFPALKGPSYLGVHLRFGTISIRQLVGTAFQRCVEGSEGASVWLGELAWRDFYFQILANFPHVATGAFKPEYDQILWEQGQTGHALFQAWCEGRTGYPIVDAAMAQLNQTGYMHNRLRMIAGSFLVKHLGMDWRNGERYFAEKLNDYDLSANNGGWQWVSSSGCDAQPYFRIFNPVTQSKRFDAQGKFIKRYLPQLAALDEKSVHAPWLSNPASLATAGVVLGQNYPHPIVDHAQARALTLQRYGLVRKDA